MCGAIFFVPDGDDQTDVTAAHDFSGTETLVSKSIHLAFKLSIPETVDIF